MAYNKEKLIEKVGGKLELKRLIEKECITYDKLRELFDTPVMSSRVMKNILDLCDATIPYPRLKPEARKWKVEWENTDGEYWKSNYIVDILNNRLKTPTINTTGISKRYVISCDGHPRKFQVKAHIILWEIHNKRYLDRKEEVHPIDGDFLNLDIDNWELTTERKRKSNNSKGSSNHFYIDGSTMGKSINYDRGWSGISKMMRDDNNCMNCDTKHSLAVHHIIPYRIFDKDDYNVHDINNLLVLCSSCHGKVHQNTIQIKPLISEMKYEKLLELLETLKSQASDTNMETLLDIEKQLGQTDNQQPSP